MSAYSSTPDSTATLGFAILPSDGSNLSTIAKALYVGNTGNITCLLEQNTESVTFSNIQGGSILPVRVKKVFETGTTATGIVGLV